MVVFLSTCDGVEFHHALLASRGLLTGGGGGGSSSGGGGGLLGKAEVLKLHGDMAQGERTASFLRFSQVRVHVWRSARLPKRRSLNLPRHGPSSAH